MTPRIRVAARAASLAIALAAPSAAAPAGEMPSAPDPRAAIDDGAWAALTRRVATPPGGSPHDAQAREVADGLSLLRMARERSAPARPAVATALSTAEQVAPARPLARGDTRDVPGSGLEVMVGRPAGPGPRAGDTCSLQRGGNVEVMGDDPEMGTLVRYASPTAPAKPEGRPCDPGTMAFVEPAALRDWPPKGDVEAQDKAMSDRVSRAADRILGATR